MFSPLDEPSIYAAWRTQCFRRLANPVFSPLGASPAFIPLGASPAFIPLGASPGFIPLGARPSPNIARNNPFPRLRGKVAEGRKGGIKNQDFSPWRKPSIYPAWRTQCFRRLARAQHLSRLARAQHLSRLADPVFSPLGGPSIYAAWRKPSVYPAWRTPKPEHCTKQSLPPLAGEGGRRPKGGNKKPGFLPLAQAQVLSRLAGPVHAAWRAQYLRRLANPVFTPLGAGPGFIPLGGPSTRRLAVSMKNPFPLPVKGLFCQVVTAVAVLPRYPSPMRQVVVLAAAGQQGLLYSHCVHRMPPLP